MRVQPRRRRRAPVVSPFSLAPVASPSSPATAPRSSHPCPTAPRRRVPRVPVQPTAGAAHKHIFLINLVQAGAKRYAFNTREGIKAQRSPQRLSVLTNDVLPWLGHVLLPLISQSPDLMRWHEKNCFR